MLTGKKTRKQPRKQGGSVNSCHLKEGENMKLSQMASHSSAAEGISSSSGSFCDDQVDEEELAVST